MAPSAKALRKVLTQPLDYLHTERFSVPLLLNTDEARRQLNALIVQGMGWGGDREAESTELCAWSRYWLHNWQHLPRVASLMGCQLHRSDLARAGAMLRLDPVHRAFIRADLGRCVDTPQPDGASVMQWVQATGLNALQAWDCIIPQALMQRLPLQFSPQVVAWQRAMPRLPMETTLFCLAVQHAQLHQDTL
ncbi:Oxygen-regulated invasion protein OrgA [Pseudomonas fluorescens]|uniref:hypothetical protein n=1 Tax=Pseudomonas fluorescens TaxID=294 RepID=UPI001240ECD0|nr:hypothetical protein [Pseudomonas fluorescens]VVP32748.1 Oxygen-regulated invasion protein OrgA [Pseudomonas fluorescens]